MPQTFFPALTYADAPAAIDWLCRAFGFERHLVVPGEDESRVAHAELRLGDAFVMLGSERDADPFGRRTPRQAGGVTQTIYAAVDDPDALHDRAVAAGADIVRPLEDMDYGSREFSARDPEGHVWSFGTYRPGAAA